MLRFLLIHFNTASLSWDPGPCHSPRLVPHPLGHLSLFSSREKHSAGSWTTTFLQLGQSFFSFHGVLCQSPLSLPPPLPLPLPPPPPLPFPPPPPVESAAMSFVFCAMTSNTCLRCSTSLVCRSVRGSKTGGTGERVVASVAQCSLAAASDSSRLSM